MLVDSLLLALVVIATELFGHGESFDGDMRSFVLLRTLSIGRMLDLKFKLLI
jgi:hypothetical protein